MAEFHKKLKSISILVKKVPNCYFFYSKDKIIKSILMMIQNDLEIIGIKSINYKQDEELPQSTENEHYFYIVSNKTKYTFITPDFRKKLETQPNSYTFLILDTINSNLEKQLNCFTCIHLTKQENYYLVILEILKRLLPNVDLQKIILQTETVNRSINNSQLSSIIDPKINLKSISINDNNLINSCFNKVKFSVFIPIIVIILLSVIILWPNIMKSKKEYKDLPQKALQPLNLNNVIASYMPEILTGNENFIGRGKELQLLKYTLSKDNIVIINGRAGIGKSTLAIEYGKQHKKNQIIRYLNAESKIKMDQQYREIAQELNINIDQLQSNLIMQLVNNKLYNLAVKILFIFDNVDEYDNVKEYIANLPPNIQTIVTTRQPLLIVNKPHVTLEEFNYEEATLYIKNSLQGKQIADELINNLAKNNGGLPYDLKCVTAYLLNVPITDINALSNELGGQIKDKLFKEFAVNNDPIKRTAWKILQYAANLDPDFINIEIMKKLLPQDLELLNITLKKLETLSLISIINNSNNHTGFKIHRNLQKNIKNSARNHAKHSINHKTLICNLMDILNNIFPEVNFTPDERWEISTGLQPHVEKLLNTEIEVANKKDRIILANLYYKLAKYHSKVNVNYHQALKYATIALNQRCELYNGINHHLANSFNLIGVIYRKVGKVQESLSHLKKGLTIRQQLYSKDHPEMADSLHNIANAYNQNGETKKGLEYAKMALKMYQRLYSGNHDAIARSLNLVGISYLDLGDHEKSLQYFKAGLEMLFAINSINYEKIAALQSNIAYNYNQLGNYIEALPYAKAAVDLFKEKYPNGHPRAIYSLDDFGDSLIKSNNVKSGLEVLHQALALSEKLNMNKHCITAFVLHDLGQGYLKDGNNKLALKYAKMAVDLRREIYSDVKNHHELAESIFSLGDIYFSLKNKKLATELYQEALAMYTDLSLEHLPKVDEIKQKIRLSSEH